MGRTLRRRHIDIAAPGPRRRAPAGDQTGTWWRRPRAVDVVCTNTDWYGENIIAFTRNWRATTWTRAVCVCSRKCWQVAQPGDPIKRTYFLILSKQLSYLGHQVAPLVNIFPWVTFRNRRAIWVLWCPWLCLREWTNSDETQDCGVVWQGSCFCQSRVGLRHVTSAPFQSRT
jgi:hypothetical protein